LSFLLHADRRRNSIWSALATKGDRPERPSKPARLQIHNPYDHAPVRVKRQFLEPEPAIEIPHPIIDRVCHHAEAADLLRGAVGRLATAFLAAGAGAFIRAVLGAGAERDAELSLSSTVAAP
jgi:hypothetical protein